MKNILRLSLLIIFVPFYLFLSGCTDLKSIDISEISKKVELVDYAPVRVEETEKLFIIQNEFLIIKFDKINCTFILTDKRNGKDINSVIDFETLESIRTSNLQKEMMGSLFTVYYANKDNVYVRNIKTTSFKTEGDNAEAKYEVRDDGLKIIIKLKQLELGFTVDLALRDDSLNIEIPGTSIVEDSNNGIISIDFLPFLGSALEDENGYFIYPDGSGALFSFEDAKKLPRSALKKYVFPIYSDDLTYLEEDNVTWYVDGDVNKPVLIPIFGINKVESGVLAMIDEGDFDASIVLSPSGSILPINQIYPNFTYRRLFNIRRSKTSVQGVEEQESTIRRMEQDPILSDKSVTYKILGENNCDYSSMAREYKSILIDKKIIPDKLPDTKTPLVADILMAVIEKRFPFNEYVTMTSFEQTNFIYNELKNNGIENIYLNLLGWSKNGFGIYPQTYKIDRRLGGKNHLDRLTNNIKNNKDNLLFQVNTIDVRNNLGGINIRNLAVTMGNGIILSNDETNRYIYNSRESARIFLKKMDTIPEGSGVTFEKIGGLVYNDYSKNNFTTREDTALIWESMFNYTKNDSRPVGIHGGNIYTYKYADVIYSIPDSDTGYLISSRTIPFLQMILKGSVIYTGLPVNLSGDISTLRLKMIEYGYTPYFLFTHDESEKLMYTNYNNLYSTEFYKWADEVTDIYNEYKYKLASIYTESIVDHDIIETNVVSVKYSNGIRVLINYNDDNYIYDEYLVEGNSYIIIKEVEN